MRELALLSVLVATTACAGVRGSGVIRSERRQAQPFKELEVSGGLDVVFRQSKETTVTIDADDNLLPLVRTRSVGERLVIEVTSRSGVDPTRPIHVVLTGPVLEKVDASGGVDLVLESGTGRTLAIEAGGGVELSAPGLDADTVTVRASGGVVLSMSGRAKAVVWDVSGGATVKARALQAQKVTVDASGGCSLELAAAEAVTGEISGGVNVVVHGDPPKSRIRASGGADVEYVN